MTLPSLRTVAIGGVGAALLVAAMVARDSNLGDTAVPVTRRGAGRAAAPGEVPVEDVNLDLLQRMRPELEAPDRNLFRFQARPRAPSRSPAQPLAQAPVAPPAGVPSGARPPQRISLLFIGLLDAPTQAGRVAILSDGRGNIMYGKEGDIIEGRYKMLKISPGAAELSYLDGRGRQTIRLSGQ